MFVVHCVGSKPSATRRHMMSAVLLLLCLCGVARSKGGGGRGASTKQGRKGGGVRGLRLPSRGTHMHLHSLRTLLRPCHCHSGTQAGSVRVLRSAAPGACNSTNKGRCAGFRCTTRGSLPCWNCLARVCMCVSWFCEVHGDGCLLRQCDFSHPPYG